MDLSEVKRKKAGYMKTCLKNLWDTDVEFIERMDLFLKDVEDETELDERTRTLAICASLVGCQALDVFTCIVEDTLEVSLKAIELKELLYQACAYLGYGKVYPFIKQANEILKQKQINLPLPSQSTTSKQTRLKKGSQAQVNIFGEHMKDFYKSGPKESVHINRWLAENCFGDYYTRNGLTLREREMITYCFLAAQGGCEPQLISHIKANIRIGNDETQLISILSQCLPYIGYPRSLNVLRCIKEAV